MQEVLVNCVVKLAPRKKCDLTIAVDWDVKHQTKPKSDKIDLQRKKYNIFAN